MSPWLIAGAFILPNAILGLLWAFDAASGYKTSMGAGFSGVVAGLEMVDLSFMPAELATALASGSAVAAFAANSRWISKRE